MNILILRSMSILTAYLTVTAIAAYSAEDIVIKESEDITVKTPLVGKKIKIDTVNNLTTEKTLNAQNTIQLNAGKKVSIKDTVISGGKINIRAGGGVIISGMIKAGGDIKISSSGDIDINAPIEGKTVDTTSGENTNIDADITGREGVSITTEGDGELNVSPTSTINSPNGKVNLNSAHQNIEGQINEGPKN